MKIVNLLCFSGVIAKNYAVKKHLVMLLKTQNIFQKTFNYIKWLFILYELNTQISICEPWERVFLRKLNMAQKKIYMYLYKDKNKNKNIFKKFREMTWVLALIGEINFSN